MGRTLKAALGGIHIFGLVAFAWSLPTFLVLSESDEFFVSYKAGNWHVAAFALFCGLILPAVAGLLFEALRRFRVNFDTPLLGVSIAVLVALALMPNMRICFVRAGMRSPCTKSWKGKRVSQSAGGLA